VAAVFNAKVDTTTAWYAQQVAFRDSVFLFLWIGGILLADTPISDVWKLLLTRIASVGLAINRELSK
jgi:hypothetical protein